MSRRKSVGLSLAAFAAVLFTLAGCSLAPNWKHPIDVPLNTAEGREQICLYNLERLLDAKEQWARETGARPGVRAPRVEVLAHKYLRQYEYGRRHFCDDDTLKSPVNVPRCPSGGEYIIGKVGELPRCSVHGDLLRDYDARLPHLVKH